MISTVYLGSTKNNLVVYGLARQTLEPVDMSQFLGEHLLYIISSFFFFSIIISNINLYKWQKVHYITFYMELSSEYVNVGLLLPS